MATGTNGIATATEIDAKIGSALASSLGGTKCPTKSQIVATGKASISGTYADNQCVKYADTAAAAPPAETVQAIFIPQNLAGHTIIGVNVYTTAGSFVSYAPIGTEQAIPKTGPCRLQFSGDQPKTISVDQPSGATMTEQSSQVWSFSGYSLGGSGLSNQIVFGVSSWY